MDKEIRIEKQEFEGYTHRFVIEFECGLPYLYSKELYANSSSKQDVELFVQTHKTEKVESFKIIHVSSKEKDEATAKFIDELFF